MFSNAMRTATAMSDSSGSRSSTEARLPPVRLSPSELVCLRRTSAPSLPSPSSAASACLRQQSLLDCVFCFRQEYSADFLAGRARVLYVFSCPSQLFSTHLSRLPGKFQTLQDNTRYKVLVTKERSTSAIAPLLASQAPSMLARTCCAQYSPGAAAQSP